MKYIYEGPVMSFDRCIVFKWRGETTANSEAKARSNLSYRFKKENHMGAGVKISLPGALTKED